VFSAQDQQDPENTALALYDISRVRGRVKGFCTTGEKCDSEVGKSAFKYSTYMFLFVELNFAID